MDGTSVAASGVVDCAAVEVADVDAVEVAVPLFDTDCEHEFEPEGAGDVDVDVALVAVVAGAGYKPFAFHFCENIACGRGADVHFIREHLLRYRAGIAEYAQRAVAPGFFEKSVKNIVRVLFHKKNNTRFLLKIFVFCHFWLLSEIFTYIIIHLQR